MRHAKMKILRRKEHKVSSKVTGTETVAIDSNDLFVTKSSNAQLYHLIKLLQ